MHAITSCMLNECGLTTYQDIKMHMTLNSVYSPFKHTTSTSCMNPTHFAWGGLQQYHTNQKMIFSHRFRHSRAQAPCGTEGLQDLNTSQEKTKKPFIQIKGQSPSHKSRTLTCTSSLWNWGSTMSMPPAPCSKGSITNAANLAWV